MKKSILICLVSLIASIVFVVVSYAADIPTSYTQLTTKDLNQMSQMVKLGLKEAKKETPPSEDVLKALTRAIFMRPNKDRMIEKVFGDVRNLMEENQQFETVISDLVTEGITKLSDEKTSANEQVSYLILLENFLSEFKPELEEVPFFKKEFRRIYDAKIVVSSKASSEKKLRLMEGATSPSETAGKVLGLDKKK